MRIRMLSLRVACVALLYLTACKMGSSCSSSQILLWTHLCIVHHLIGHLCVATNSIMKIWEKNPLCFNKNWEHPMIREVKFSSGGQLVKICLFLKLEDGMDEDPQWEIKIVMGNSEIPILEFICLCQRWSHFIHWTMGVSHDVCYLVTFLD
jgi:hypothetical protein